MENSDSTSPERALFCREEEDGGRPDIMLSRGGWHYQPPLEMVFQGRLMPPAAPENRPHFQGRLTAPPASEKEPCFQGRMVPSPAPEDAFPGAGQLLQYSAPVVGAGYICNRSWKKNEASLEIISVVVVRDHFVLSGCGIQSNCFFLVNGIQSNWCGACKASSSLLGFKKT